MSQTTSMDTQGIAVDRRCGFKQIFTTLFSAWFALSSVVGQLVYAQSSGTDFESPIIEHEATDGGVIGALETFDAIVVDNDRLESVKLFYRFSGDTVFNEVEMIPVAASSNYSTQVDTSNAAEAVEAIEYYIRAEDASGNLVLKGFAFEPLKRMFEMPEAAAVEPVATAEPVKPKKKVNWLYVGLGILAVGAIAGAAGGDKSDPAPTSEGPNTVTVTISPP